MSKAMQQNGEFLPVNEVEKATEITKTVTTSHPKKSLVKSVNFDEIVFERATETEFDEFFTFENDGDQIVGVVIGVSTNPKVEGYLIDTLNGGIVCIPIYSAITKVVEEFTGNLNETIFRFTRLNKSKISGTSKDYISFRIEKAGLNG